MRLTLWQRYLGRVPGCNEGWALYAESLGEELGLVEEPQDRFGLLAARRWRLARVLVDLGCIPGCRCRRRCWPCLGLTPCGAGRL
ncbi:DUF885 family protein [Actinomyces lilanjuaniae]|uniref:DUF885 family protein n=1 Tax=Actinomyces lilanjuaniae TaxID=2321394 RepID=UPI00242E0B36|nr:DUF885 family protein [Actinomyces lilanjuaniae]